MAEDVETQVNEQDMDWDDLLSQYDAEVEEAEKGKDEQLIKIAKNQRQLAEKQAKMEAQNERERLVAEFYAKASDDAKQFADVFLAGVVEPDKVKKMLELAEAKAKALAPEPEGSNEEEEDSDEDESEVEKAFSPPVESQRMSPKDPAKERAERTRKGDVHAAFIEYMDLPATAGPPKVGE